MQSTRRGTSARFKGWHMEYILRVVSGRHAGQSLRILWPRFLIGRGEDCHLRPSSDSVSRQHCLLSIDGERVSVRDLDSRNGTFVNGQRLAGERSLKSGDRLAVGRLEFEIQLETPISVASLTAKRLPAQEAKIGPEEQMDLDLMDLFREASAHDTVALASSETMASPGPPVADETPPPQPSPSMSAPPPPNRGTSRPADGGAAAAHILRSMLRRGS